MQISTNLETISDSKRILQISTNLKTVRKSNIKKNQTRNDINHTLRDPIHQHVSTSPSQHHLITSTHHHHLNSTRITHHQVSTSSHHHPIKSHHRTRTTQATRFGPNPPTPAGKTELPTLPLSNPLSARKAKTKKR
jgi:hypothetical protein